MIPKKFQQYNPIFLARGKRGEVYKFDKDSKEYIIKIKRKDSEAKDRIINEAKFLRILNKEGIGPEIIESTKSYILMEFIKGQTIKEYLRSHKNVKESIRNLLSQCFILDKLKINKLEMHKPLKHIIINKNKVTLIDFERCYYTEYPKNVTQFCEFINRLHKEFPKKIKSIKKELIQEYKAKQTKENINRILEAI